MFSRDRAASLMRWVFALVLSAGGAIPAAAALTVDLVAMELDEALPGGTVRMWGFVPDVGQPCAVGTDWNPLPPISASSGESLTINLRNCLAEATSVMIPGQLPATATPAVVGGRAHSLTHETPSDLGATAVSYVWPELKAGTFLYRSGSNLAKQVQMGLYGVLVVDGAASDQVLLYSEVDPALHAPPAAALPLNYSPRYFLVNGSPSPQTLAAGTPGAAVRLRLLNAGLRSHAPSLLGGHLDFVAEDGNPYPHAPRRQVGALLAPGKTLDALFVPAREGTYALYDRRLDLSTNGAPSGGMLSYLEVAAGGLPVADAGPDQSGSPVGTPTPVSLDAAGSSCNTTCDSYAWSFLARPAGSSAALTDAAIVNPQFTPDEAGTYELQLLVGEGGATSNADTVLVITNQIPDADAGPDRTVSPASLVTLDGSASSDPDGPDPLSFSWSLVSKPATSAAALAGASTPYPTFTADVEGNYVVALTVDDGDLSASDSVTLTAVNLPPVAVDDAARTPRNTPVVIPVLANDSDPDGSLDPASVVVVTRPTRGGTATVNADGTITFTPRSGFRGTDVFRYRVRDNLGALSNRATVRINVR